MVAAKFASSTTLAADGEADPTNLRLIAIERVQELYSRCRACDGLQSAAAAVSRPGADARRDTPTLRSATSTNSSNCMV